MLTPPSLATHSACPASRARSRATLLPRAAAAAKPHNAVCRWLLQRTRWQPEEEAELIRLVKQHGRGNWAAIVAQGQNVFVDRTPVSALEGRMSDGGLAGRDCRVYALGGQALALASCAGSATSGKREA